MTDALLASLAVLVAAATCVLITLYVRYLRTPATQWKGRVLASVREHEAQIRSSQMELARLDRDANLRSLREEFLNRLLSGIAVEELIRFPGIGPATASRARDAGLSNLAALTRANLNAIPGVGPARAKDLREAIRQLRHEAESRFDAGACQEAVAFAEERKRREAGRLGQRLAAEQAIRSAEAALAGMEDLTRFARAISFLGYLLRRPVEGLTDELMAKPLPAPNEIDVGQRTRVSEVAAATPLTPNPSPPEAGGEGRKAAVAPLDQLRAVAAFGLAMAKADGRIAASERRQIRAFLERRYTQGPELIGMLDSVLAEVEASVPPLRDAIFETKRLIPQSAWPELYQFASAVADAAGERNTREIECLARIAELLGIGVKPAAPPEPAPAVFAPDTPLTENDCRAALEISMDSPLSVELIRRQYHLLADRFGPDRFASHGPEFVRMAAEKRDRAERAARHLLASYNEPLEPPAAAPPADLRHNPDLDEVFGA